MKLTVERLKELLHYDPAKGTFTWRISRGGKARAGSVAGNVQASGHIVIHLDGKTYHAGRLAWLYQTGSWPNVGFDIEHEDVNPTNNRWANLRLATRSQNQANKPRQKNNTSGFKGVFWNKSNKKWQAAIRKGTKATHLGYFTSPEEAHAAYCKAATELFGEFANFGT